MFSPNLMANWSFNGDGRLAKEGVADTQFLILGVVLAVIWAILLAMFLYYLISFKKAQADEKIYGKPLLYTNLTIAIAILVCWILVFVFWSKGQAIFGEEKASSCFAALVSLVVIGFVSLLSLMIMMWFFLPSYGIAFTNSQILFMGEAINYNKITKIVKDTKTGNLYVNYAQGKRSHKKQKFNLSSVFGQFVLANAPLTGHEVVSEDQLEYFKSLVNNDKMAEEINDQMIADKLKEQSKKEKIVTEVDKEVNAEIKTEVKEEKKVDSILKKEVKLEEQTLKADEKVVKKATKPKSATKPAPKKAKSLDQEAKPVKKTIKKPASNPEDK